MIIVEFAQSLTQDRIYLKLMTVRKGSYIDEINSMKRKTESKTESKKQTMFKLCLMPMI